MADTLIKPVVVIVVYQLRNRQIRKCTCPRIVLCCTSRRSEFTIFDNFKLLHSRCTCWFCRYCKRLNRTQYLNIIPNKAKNVESYKIQSRICVQQQFDFPRSVRLQVIQHEVNNWSNIDKHNYKQFSKRNNFLPLRKKERGKKKKRKENEGRRNDEIIRKKVTKERVSTRSERAFPEAASRGPRFTPARSPKRWNEGNIIPAAETSF